MNYKSINFKNKFSLFQDKWKPKVIAELNDYQFKIAKLEGDFIWHAHPDTDEAFIVISGELRIDFRDGAVTISEGELFVVPKGMEHKPYAKNEVHLMMIEPVGVKNTGNQIESENTAENYIWI